MPIGRHLELHEQAASIFAFMAHSDLLPFMPASSKQPQSTKSCSGPRNGVNWRN